MTRTIGASQSGTLDGGPVTWTPPGVLGFARDSRPRGTRVDFDAKVTKVPRSTKPLEAPFQISTGRRTVPFRRNCSSHDNAATERGLRESKNGKTIPGGRCSERSPMAKHGDRTGSANTPEKSISVRTYVTEIDGAIIHTSTSHANPRTSKVRRARFYELIQVQSNGLPSSTNLEDSILAPGDRVRGIGYDRLARLSENPRSCPKGEIPFDRCSRRRSTLTRTTHDAKRRRISRDRKRRLRRETRW